MLLKCYLEPLGFIIEEAGDGREGIAIAETFQPDVILVDLLMPVMNGKEMIKRIRQHPQLRDTLMLMISANVQSIIDSSSIDERPRVADLRRKRDIQAPEINSGDSPLGMREFDQRSEQAPSFLGARSLDEETSSGSHRFYGGVISDCDGFLAKPVDLEKLLGLLEQHLELNWQTSNERSQLETLTEGQAQQTPSSLEEHSSTFNGNSRLSDSEILLSEDTETIGDFVTPSQEELTKLLKLVNFGNMKAVLQQIDLLEKADSRYISFAKKVRQFAGNCQQDRLEKLLNNHLKQENYN